MLDSSFPFDKVCQRPIVEMMHEHLIRRLRLDAVRRPAFARYLMQTFVSPLALSRDFAWHG